MLIAVRGLLIDTERNKIYLNVFVENKIYYLSVSHEASVFFWGNFSLVKCTVYLEYFASEAPCPSKYVEVTVDRRFQTRYTSIIFVYFIRFC